MSSMDFFSSNRCRFCAKELVAVLELGSQPRANAFLSNREEGLKAEFYYPLTVTVCSACFITQIAFAPKRLPLIQYPYVSGSSHRMCQHFVSIAESIQDKYVKSPQDLVVDIGSNDGTFLSGFSSKKARVLGIEPCENLASLARSKGIQNIVQDFNFQLVESLHTTQGMASCIFSANTLTHIEDLHSTFLGLRRWLKPEGVLIIEEPYLPSILTSGAFDQFYDEHIYSLSLSSLTRILLPFELEVFDIERLTTHGGSMRYYIGHADLHPRYAIVDQVQREEREAELESLTPYFEFAKRCERHKRSIMEKFRVLKEKGHKIVGYGATAKSSTLLNYCQIDDHFIDYMVDTIPYKQGYFTPGSHIPIRSADYFRKDSVDYAFLFAWNHLEEILDREPEFVEKGGTWLTPPWAKTPKQFSQSSHSRPTFPASHFDHFTI